MANEGSGSSIMQVEVNRTDIRWLKEHSKEINKKLGSIETTLFRLMVAVAFGAVGFIGTLLLTFLDLG